MYCLERPTKKGFLKGLSDRGRSALYQCLGEDVLGRDEQGTDPNVHTNGELQRGKATVRGRLSQEMGDAGAGEANLTGFLDTFVDSCMLKDLICKDWIGEIRSKIKDISWQLLSYLLCIIKV